MSSMRLEVEADHVVLRVPVMRLPAIRRGAEIIKGGTQWLSCVRIVDAGDALGLVALDELMAALLRPAEQMPKRPRARGRRRA